MTPLVLKIGTICFQVYSCNQYSHRSSRMCCRASIQSAPERTQNSRQSRIYSAKNRKFSITTLSFSQLHPPCSQNRHGPLPSLFLQPVQSSVVPYVLSCQCPISTGTSPNITSKSHPQAVVVNLTPLVLKIGTICFQVYTCNRYSHRSCHICCLVSVQ